MTYQYFLILVWNNSNQIVALYQIKFINDHIKRQNLHSDAVFSSIFNDLCIESSSKISITQTVKVQDSSSPDFDKSVLCDVDSFCEE